MTSDRHQIDTLSIHAGEPRPPIGGAVSMPIFQSATFAYGGASRYEDLKYIRLNNTPNHDALHAKLAALEGGAAALVTASGMAAIATTLLALLGPGDRLLVQDGLYGGTHGLIHGDLRRMGVAADVLDPDPAAWDAQVGPATRAVYVETITNPLMQVIDLEAVADLARRRGLTAIVDNTFATPVNFRPLEWGFDLSLHSATKYLNGHSDIVAGAVVGRADLVGRVRGMLAHLGGALDPHACFLLHRGLKTLALRVRHQNAAAAALARWLEDHPAVARVYYPGLAGHPGHRRAQRLFGGCGGMLSFELAGGTEAAERLLARLTLPMSAPSLGGVETLITRPATTSHVGVDPEERRRMGIADGLVRLSVGVEALADLQADFERALSGV